VRPAAPARDRRIDALDGLRGLAAIVVVGRHTLNAAAMSDATRRTILESPLGLVLCGDGAVRVFFVLSGWVLAGSLARGRGLRGALQFWVRRVLRIYPPYVVGVLFSWAAAFVYAGWYAGALGHPALSEWLARLGAIHRSFEHLLPFLAFPGHADIQMPVGWTLYVEMVFSLLLPVLVLAARPLRGIPLLGVGIALLVLWPAEYLPAHALDFALGIVSFQERAALQRVLGSLPLAAAGAGVAAAVVLSAAPVFFGWSIPVDGILITPRDTISGLLMSLGGWGLVAATLFRPWLRRVLATRPIVAVGNSAYSLYLFHMPVLLTSALAVHAPLGWPGGIALFAVVLGVSEALAMAGWRCIERPTIAAGERLSARLG